MDTASLELPSPPLRPADTHTSPPQKSYPLEGL